MRSLPAPPALARDRRTGYAGGVSAWAIRWFQWAVAASLTVCTGLFVVWSWRWPLVGDAALIHYIGFLIGRGWVPYRQLGDMNMPGSFLIEMGAMRVFGGGALGWRLFDFSLLAVAAVSFRVVTRRAGWFAAVFAAGMFALVHGRDGLAQGGQRDLTMAVLLVAATALLFCGVRWRNGWATLGFGLLAGMALTIKPTAGLVSLAQLGVAGLVLRGKGENPTQQDRWRGHGVWGAGLGMLVGPGVCLGWLWRLGALGAFRHGLRTVDPYYASLGHRPLGWLVLHSVSPLLGLVAIWGVMLVVARPRWDWERAVLGCGVVFGLASYVVQARGLPYYRYPLLAFLLPLMALDFAEAMHGWGVMRMKVAAGLAVAGLAVGGFFLGPQSAVKVHRYRWWETDFISSLEGNLERLGGSRLSGRVQCVDTISGCGATLYRMGLVSATGMLSDFLLFGRDDAAAVKETRTSFSGAVEARPPEVVVVSSYLYMDGSNGYEKLRRWPWIDDWLAENYRLDTDWVPGRRTRWWSQEETPAKYRIYVRR